MLAFFGEGQYQLLFSFKPLDAVLANQLEPHLGRTALDGVIHY
jgi:hypothetical protein